MPEYMTTAEASRVLSVSDTSLRNWAKEGRLQPFRIGHQDIWRKAEIEKIREEREAKS